MKLELQEMEKLYGEEQKIKDQYYKRREKKTTLRNQGGVKRESPIWDDEDWVQLFKVSSLILT